ncbi:ABC transporter ATP-binding protein [Amycolatopsis sp. GM8]|uniref:ABC transporter ATP-binding protein n=1 Tax=Amycolatopsis sp. GM8 TaxID=2896530 RepID=UPI001F02A4C1|nr:oligopeptide/dipeptide ABC transporter ATP-binding protein [Amycolatopsis sp. GM8]
MSTAVNTVPPDTAPVLEVKSLSKHYRVSTNGGLLGAKRTLKAAEDVSFAVPRGRTLGIVGESGSGKSTTGQALLRLTEPTSGTVTFDGQDVLAMKGAQLKDFRRRAQMVFQDPYSSLNPRKRVGETLAEPLAVHRIGDRAGREDKVMAILEKMGLRPDFAYRYPHELSGGQRQRVGLGRALISEPELVVCDEAVSALDVSVQAQILNLLSDLQAELNLAYVFITHDISVVRHISNDLMVMYLGRVVETGPTQHVIANPAHPYTKALISAVPTGNTTTARERTVLRGDVPSAMNGETGCPFAPRCPIAQDICREQAPQLRPLDDGSAAACHFA